VRLAHNSAHVVKACEAGLKLRLDSAVLSSRCQESAVKRFESAVRKFGTLTAIYSVKQVAQLLDCKAITYELLVRSGWPATDQPC
jgi:hypothetical protein